jgi:hypothetical protein
MPLFNGPLDWTGNTPSGEGKRGALGPIQGGGVMPLPPLPTPRLLEGFEDTSNWALTAGAPTLTVDTNRKVQGAGALQVAATGATAPQTTKANIGTLDPSAMGTIAFYVDLGLDPAEQTLTSIAVQLGQGGTYQNTAGINGMSGVNNATLGGYWVAYHVSELPGLAALGLAQTGARVSTGHASPYVQKPAIDCLMSNAAGRAFAVITFDDVRSGQFDTAFPILAAAGGKASCYVPTALVGGPDNRMTLANIKALDAALWDMALDGTNDDTVITTRATRSAWIAELLAMQQWLVDNGLNPRAKNHICWPNGTRHDPAALADGEWYNGKPTQALRDAGFISARGVNNGVAYERFGLGSGRAYNLASNGASNPANIDAYITQLDRALLRGCPVRFHFHNVTSTPTGQDIHTDRFVELVAAIKARGMPMLTLSEAQAQTQPLPF